MKIKSENSQDELPEYRHIPLTKVLMLQEQLNTVPWSQLTHLYGSAKDTPLHLLALLSSRARERKEALSALATTICQDITEASCAAIPFLIKILEQIPEKQQPAILDLLDGLALCEYYAERKLRFIEVDRFTNTNTDHYQWFSREEYLQAINSSQKLRWIELAHRLVGDNIPTILKMLPKAGRRVKMRILYLLSGFQELHQSFVPVIEPFLFSSTDILVQVYTLFCLSALLDENSVIWEYYLTLALSNHDKVPPLLRYTAAISLAKYKPSAVVPGVADILIDAMIDPDKLNAFSRQLPYRWLNWVHVEACFVLSQLGVPIGSQGIQKALEQKASSWPILDTLRVAEALLDVAFFGGWIQNRYWSLDIRGKPAFAAFAAEKKLGGSSYPYGHGQLIEYGSRTPSRSSALKVECSGYDEDEAERLRSQYEQQGREVLTDAQRQAIKAIVDCKPLWLIESDFLQMYGLPTRRKKLKKFLAEHS
ncbi:MAG TPA: hypothetical protein VIZ18_15845 [Ktedonobacteraceae bacterium]